MNLHNPNTVKTWLSKKDENEEPLCKWSNKTKVKFCDTYTTYLTFKGLTWKAPTYTLQEKDYFIPLEEELELLINGVEKSPQPYF